MTSSRAFASLSSALLARKGGARPAMRSALHDPAHDPAEAPRHDPLSDLGWNDMGFDVTPASAQPAPAPADMTAPLAVVVFEPAQDPLPEAAAPARLLASKPAPAEVVPLLREAPAAPSARSRAVRPVSLGEIGTRAITRRTRTAAFTLRLDPDRHYRLRVACALQARSAQSLVTEAVDRFLDQQPDLNPLAAVGGAQRIA